MSVLLYNDAVTNATKQDIYASRLQASLLKFARTVTGQAVSLQINRVPYPSGSPAWSTERAIVLSHHAGLGNISSAKNIIRLKGLTVHELAHVMYTPRDRTHFMKWVMSNNYGTTFNMLEDNRIENIMVSNMSGIKPWLVHTVTTELLDGTTEQEQAAVLPLVWGRKYLPDSVRSAAYKAWNASAQTVMPITAKYIADLVDEYIVLNFHDKAHIATAQRIIADLHAALNMTQDVPKNPQHGKDQLSAPSSSSQIQQPGKRDTDNSLKDVQKQVSQDTAAEEAESSGLSGNGSESTNSATSVGESLRSARSDAEADVLEDVKNTIDAIRDAESDSSFADDNEVKPEYKVIRPVPRRSIQYQNVSVEAINSSRRFAKELQEVRAMFDPAWVRKSSQGRLNVRDYMLGADLDESFDLWDQGNEDVTDIECVILLDNSGSMRSMIDSAYESMWSIKRALDTVGADTTVIQFGTYGEVLYSPDTKATTRMATARYSGGGNTNPLFSLIKAKEILFNSSRAIKMLIVITDGYWGNSDACNQVVATLRSSGVLTGLVYLEEKELHNIFKRTDDNGNTLYDAHYCEMFTKLDDPSDIVDFAKQLASVSRKRLLNL